MLILGICGGADPAHANETRLLESANHDSSVVLLKDGELIAALEEERLNRIKHTNKFPARALRACLDMAGVGLARVDYVALNIDETMFDHGMREARFGGQSWARILHLDPSADESPRALVEALLHRYTGQHLPAERIHFVKHHVAHAWSAFAASGFDEALVMTLDGQGDTESGSVSIGAGRSLRLLQSFAEADSLGQFYTRGTLFLGFHLFDQYKVMGLAPYGDPSVYRHHFKQLYALLPEGGYRFTAHIRLTLEGIMKPRLADEPLEQHHKDFAASLQESLEEIVFHMLDHLRRQTRMKNLCLAGGVAHNCTLNGKILAKDWFSRVYVQPASHDAGGAWGAAISAHLAAGARADIRPAHNLFLGRDVNDTAEIAAKLLKWQPFISSHHSDDVAREAARLLAAGSVIGWVQGRSEFGPRALGNRSILADPRPAQNKGRINAMIKKREDFRPFAPAVLAESAREYFEVQNTEADLSHMTYVLKVRSEHRASLGAVTHVDGSARVQTVSAADNPRFWKIIYEFGALTGVPILLNTSFNNNAEPIVDTVDDAVVCFLTTGLDYIVIGDFIITKQSVSEAAWHTLKVGVPCHISIRYTRVTEDNGACMSYYELYDNTSLRGAPISKAVFQLLDRAGTAQDPGNLVNEANLSADVFLPELLDLWGRRLITLAPTDIPEPLRIPAAPAT